MQQHIDTVRGQFYIRTYGNLNDPPLFLIHGWPQSGYSWHHVAPFLEGLYVIAPDLRGLGDSNRELDESFYKKNQLAEDIFAIADGLGFKTFYLGGHDWGGAVVQEMAFMRPNRVIKMIVINMFILNNPIGQAKAEAIQTQQRYRSSWYQSLLSIKDFPEALIKGKEELWVRLFSRGISNPLPEDAIQEYVRCFKIPNTLTTMANFYRTFEDDRKRWLNYAESMVDIPTLFIHGTQDPVILTEYLEGVENYFSHLKIERLKGGHFIAEEQPELVGKFIHSFLLNS